MDSLTTDIKIYKVSLLYCDALTLCYNLKIERRKIMHRNAVFSGI